MKTRMFFRSFFLTFLLLIWPLLMMLAIGVIHDRSAGLADLSSNAFSCQNGEFIFFQVRLPLDWLSRLGIPGVFYRALFCGLPTLGLSAAHGLAVWILSWI